MSTALILLSFHLINFGLVAEDITKNRQTSFMEKFQQHDYKVNFERAEIGAYTKELVKFANATTFKYNRTCPLANSSVEFKVDLGYKVEFILQAYRFASNEYRLFPLRFQMNFCQAVAANVGGIGDFRRCGTFTECPIVKEKIYTICNWAPIPTMFPPYLPEGQYMVEVQAMFQSTELYVVRGYGIAFHQIKF